MADYIGLYVTAEATPVAPIGATMYVGGGPRRRVEAVAAMWREAGWAIEFGAPGRSGVREPFAPAVCPLRGCKWIGLNLGTHYRRAHPLAPALADDAVLVAPVIAEENRKARGKQELARYPRVGQLVVEPNTGSLARITLIINTGTVDLDIIASRRIPLGKHGVTTAELLDTWLPVARWRKE